MGICRGHESNPESPCHMKAAWKCCPVLFLGISLNGHFQTARSLEENVLSCGGGSCLPGMEECIGLTCKQQWGRVCCCRQSSGFPHFHSAKWGACNVGADNCSLFFPPCLRKALLSPPPTSSVLRFIWTNVWGFLFLKLFAQSNFYSWKKLLWEWGALSWQLTEEPADEHWANLTFALNGTNGFTLILTW